MNQYLNSRNKKDVSISFDEQVEPTTDVTFDEPVFDEPEPVFEQPEVVTFDEPVF